MKRKIGALAAIGLMSAFAASCGNKHEASSEKPPAVQGARVEKISTSSIEDHYEATGTVHSRTTTTLSSKIMGSVASLRVREGDRVGAGQTLIEIDNREANAQLQKANAGSRQSQEGLAEVEQSINAAKSAQAAAEANKRLADSTFERYRALFERKSVSQQEFDEARARRDVADAEARRAGDLLKVLAAKKQQALAQIDQAKAEISSAQIFAGYSRIVSPISGIVTARHTEVGSIATPGTPLLTIEDASRYRLEAVVDESQIGRIKLREKTRVRIDALAVNDLEGVVAEIMPSADPGSRSYTVKIDLPARQAMRSGMYGVAAFVSGQKQAIVVPQKAIVQRGQLTGVFVVDDGGIARLRLIKTGKSYGDSVEIISGLSDGERVIVDGLAKVNDGSRIQ